MKGKLAEIARRQAQTATQQTRESDSAMAEMRRILGSEAQRILAEMQVLANSIEEESEGALHARWTRGQATFWYGSYGSPVSKLGEAEPDLRHSLPLTFDIGFSLRVFRPHRSSWFSRTYLAARILAISVRGKMINRHASLAGKDDGHNDWDKHDWPRFARERCVAFLTGPNEPDGKTCFVVKRLPDNADELRL